VPSFGDCTFWFYSADKHTNTQRITDTAKRLTHATTIGVSINNATYSQSGFSSEDFTSRLSRLDIGAWYLANEFSLSLCRPKIVVPHPVQVAVFIECRMNSGMYVCELYRAYNDIVQCICR